MCTSVIPAGGQVYKGEDVILDEAGEGQEDSVQEETYGAQALVQCPPVQVNSQDLHTPAKRESAAVRN